MAHFEIIERDLKGAESLMAAERLFYVQQTGMKLRQIKITLNNDEITTEAGALHFMKGNIKAENKIPGLKSYFKSKMSGESVFRPTYSGTGEIYLEPTFGHFIIYELSGESLIVDKGIYYASDASVKVEIASQKNISSALFGGEGFFQTKLSGAGRVVLVSPTPEDELVKYQLNDESLKVDGNFAILRTEGLKFTAEKSAKGLLGSAFSGEGLLQTFTGAGEVWLAPLQSVYKRFEALFGGIQTSQQKGQNSGALDSILKSVKGGG